MQETEHESCAEQNLSALPLGTDQGASGPRNRLWEGLFLGLLVAGLFCTVLVHLSQDSFSLFILRAARHSPQNRHTAPLEKIDAAVLGAWPEGDAFARFIGFDPTRPDQEPLVSMLYYRSVYVLYPRRVYVGKPRDIVNNGRDLLRENADRAEKWHRRRGVGTRVDISLLENGTVSFVRRQPTAGPP